MRQKAVKVAIFLSLVFFLAEKEKAKGMGWGKNVAANGPELINLGRAAEDEEEEGVGLHQADDDEEEEGRKLNSKGQMTRLESTWGKMGKAFKGR